MGDPSNAIGLLEHRHDLLDALLDGPREKRDLEATLGVSRSTVDRGVRDLEVARYIRRTADGYVVTLSGRLALESYRDYTAAVRDAETAAEALRPLDADVAIPADVVEDADVARVDTDSRHDPPAPIRSALRDAETVRAVLPQVSMRTPARWYERVVERGRRTDVVLPPGRYRELTETVPGLIHGLCGDDAFRALAADAPEYGVLLADTGDGTTAYVVTYAAGRPHGVVRHDGDAAVRWATETYQRYAATATDVTADLRAGTAGVEPRFARQSSRAALAGQGFVELTDAYFADREPSASCFQTGFGLVEVAAGYAIYREYVPDAADGTPALVEPSPATGDERQIDADDGAATGGAVATDDRSGTADSRGGRRRNLPADLAAGLRAGVDHAVIGPPGSGKSTVCKQVACRWHDAGDPVFYRESGAGTTFSEPAEFGERLRSVDGRALVVVEDAVRNEANAVFRLLSDFRDSDDVVFLLDAREAEWQSPESFPLDAELDRYRIEAVETVAVPPLDERDCERLVERFESVVGHRVDRTSSALLDDVSADGDDGGPAELLLLLHRLSRYVDSLSGGATAPTSFAEDVNRAFASFAEAGDATLDVAVLLNLLNAAGLAARPELAYALADGGSDGSQANGDARRDDVVSYAAVADALAELSGRVLFEREDGTLRSVHESWSGRLLDRLLEAEGERAAAARVGRVVSALLSLADDPERRERIEWECGGDAPAIAAIEDDPTEWADSTATALFTFPVNYPAVAPLFGSSAHDPVSLPDACSAGVAWRLVELRGRMHVHAGNHDRAEREFERLAAFDDRAVQAARYKWLGTVARLRSEFDAAEERFEEALDVYVAIDDRAGVADCLNNLGTVALQRGDLDAAESFLDRSLEIHRDRGDVRAEADVQFNLASTYDSLGDLDSAVDHYEACLESYRDVGSRRLIADVHNNLGVAYKNRGDVDVAAEHYARSLDAYRELGDAVGAANALFNLGVVDRRRGDLDAAEARYESVLERYRDVGDRQGEAEVLDSLAGLALDRGDLERAEALAGDERPIREDIGDILGCGRCHHRLAEVALARGDLDDAESAARTAMGYFERAGGTPGALRTSSLLALVDVRRGDLDDAADRLRTALDGCLDHGYRYSAADVHAARAELAQARGDDPATRDEYESALALYEDSGAVLDVIETRCRLAETAADLGDVDAARAYCDRALTLAQDAAVDPAILDGPSLDDLTERLAGTASGTSLETD